MEAKHTPGPWCLSERGCDVVGGAVIVDDNGGEVFGVSEWCRVEPADAVLMAAAPDLLAALIELERAATDASVTNTAARILSASIHNARAVIARATVQS